jgi:hypothetical protein
MSYTLRAAPFPSLWFLYAPGNPDHGALLTGPPEAPPDKAVQYVFFSAKQDPARHLKRWYGGDFVSTHMLTANWAAPGLAKRKASLWQSAYTSVKTELDAIITENRPDAWPTIRRLEQALLDLRNLGNLLG